MSFNLLADEPPIVVKDPVNFQDTETAIVEQEEVNPTEAQLGQDDTPAQSSIQATTDTEQEPIIAIDIVNPRKGQESDDGVSDEEDWDEISKGRYFGIADEQSDGPLCHNCKQSGHKKKDCPHQLCRSCGALDDHDTMRCPMTQRCYNCSRLGHQASKCPEPQRQHGSYCRQCGSRSHLDRSCPQIWRLYLPAPNFVVDGDWDVKAWCYNCAASGHYGDDCPKPHRARLIEQSAFCLANLPESRKQRSKREDDERRQANRHVRLDEEEKQDDWFARQDSSTRSNAREQSQHHGKYRPPPPPAARQSRGETRFDPYARPSKAAPVITSERFPRGYSGKSDRGRGAGNGTRTTSFSGSTRKAEKRQPVPASVRLARQNQSQRAGQPSTRGGKAYRGGGRR